MRIIEIFSSIEMEGKRVGTPVTFIQMSNCNLNCTYCDAKYTQSPTAGVDMTINEIMSRVKKLRLNVITVTGGEPLINSETGNLLQALSNKGYKINVETNGSMKLHPYMYIPNIFFTVNFKLPSSGHNNDMYANYCDLTKHDVVKFVVGTEDDLSMVDTFLNIYSECRAQKFISPVINKIKPRRLVDWVLEEPIRHDVRVQIEPNKAIYTHDVRGV